MLGHYLLVTLRNLGRQRLHSALALLVLALGLTCFLAASLFALYFSSFDRQLANADRIYVIYQRASWPQIGYRAELGRRSGFGVAEKLASEIPEIEAVARQANVGATVSVSGGPGMVRGIQATDPEWFDIFAFRVVAGETRGALARQSTVVLAESTAIELFGSAAEAVGQTITFTGQQPTDFTVAGVVEDVEGPSHLGQTVLAPGIQIIASWDLSPSCRSR
jgi:putative ABC transport system permease protein